MNAPRRGPLIVASWLIGLGVVLLAREIMGIEWTQGWPLFVIFLGVVGGITTALNGPRGVAGVWAFTWPVVWTVAGIALLASTTGGLGIGPLELLAQWWPVAIVAIGVWFVIGAVLPIGGGPQESLVVPLESAAEGEVRIKFAAGELTTVRAEHGDLVDGRFAGGVVARRNGPGRVELSQDTAYAMPWLGRASEWTVGLSGEVPLDLRLDTGAARSQIDLSDTLVRNLELHTGASDTRIRLPRAAGLTSVRAETGAASLVIEVPTGVGATIRSRMTLGNSFVDEKRFARVADGFASPDYATAANRAVIDIQGGVGSVRIVGIA